MEASLKSFRLETASVEDEDADPLMALAEDKLVAHTPEGAFAQGFLASALKRCRELAEAEKAGRH